MSESSVRTPRQVKRERVRSVAQRLFIQAGFAGASMDAIALAAGVSKPTLYRYYHDKETLFAEVLRDLSVRRVWRQLPPVAEEITFSSRSELAAALVAIAESALQHLLDPTYLGLLRVLIAEIPRSPQLAELFRASVLEEGPRMLSSVLERARAAGLVRLPHPDVATRLFVGPLLSYVLADGLLADPSTSHQPSSEEIAALTDLFVAAIS